MVQCTDKSGNRGRQYPKNSLTVVTTTLIQHHRAFHRNEEHGWRLFGVVKGENSMVAQKEINSIQKTAKVAGALYLLLAI